jgi:hypothetical protein
LNSLQQWDDLFSSSANSVNDGIQGLSDWIIYGNYFNQKEIE